VESNCLSVEPKETPFGRKRQINLSTCNKDFSCVNGFCPSFVTVEGAARRKKRGTDADVLARAKLLPHPSLPELEKPYNLLVTGVGGTGVITVGALITMAAHLEGKGASVLDFTGFAQKFGPVLSFIRLSNNPDDIHQVRIDQGAADALIGCDIVVSSSPKASISYGEAMHAVVNTAEMPTGDIVRHRDASLSASARLKSIARLVGADHLASFDANRAAEALLGDSVFANVMMLGAAWQRGLVPVSFEALMRAIELNGVAVEQNRQAFAGGRLAAADETFIASLLGQTVKEETLEELIARRSDFLTGYQNSAYAGRYTAFVDHIRRTEDKGLPGSTALTTAVAKSLFKLMAYKDEYEVARLHMETGFLDRLKQEFEGNFAVNYHLAPPLLSSGKDARGRPLKRTFGPWIQKLFRLLARLKFLRGTALDVFGYAPDRRLERELIGWYEALITGLLPQLRADTIGSLAKIAALPMEIRGYGPVKEIAVREVKATIARLEDDLHIERHAA
jgi:indolepyruvate ferredoxin oxidoreductase